MQFVGKMVSNRNRFVVMMTLKVLGR